jgi:hypothetical protein
MAEIRILSAVGGRTADLPSEMKNLALQPECNSEVQAMKARLFAW